MKKKSPQTRVDSGNTKMGERPILPPIQQIESWNKRSNNPNLPPNTPSTPAPFISQDTERLNILQWLDSPANYGTNNFIPKPNKKIENTKIKKHIKPPRMRRMEK